MVEETWDEVEKLLSDGRMYLFGDTFGAADLTMCAMSAPEFLPPEYGHPLPELTEIPKLSRRPFGKHGSAPLGNTSCAPIGRCVRRQETHRRGMTSVSR